MKGIDAMDVLSHSNQPLILSYEDINPSLDDTVFIAPTAVVLGDARIKAHANIWFYSVIRGDVHYISIGEKTNIQDHCVLHVTGGEYPILMGNRVMVGHRATLHGCEIHDNALIGIGSLVLDGAVVEENAVVAAGAIVTPNSIIPAGMVAMGAPAKPVRKRKSQEIEGHHLSIDNYAEYAANFSKKVKAAQIYNQS